MTTQNTTKLRSTISALVAVLVMFGPDIVEALDVRAESPGWLKALAKVVGLVIGLATSGKAVALLNMFMPAPAAGKDSASGAGGTDTTAVSLPASVVSPAPGRSDLPNGGSAIVLVLAGGLLVGSVAWAEPTGLVFLADGKVGEIKDGAEVLVNNGDAQYAKSVDLGWPVDRMAIAISDVTVTDTSTSTGPETCEVTDGSGDLEPCAWQKERAAAAEAHRQELKNQDECRARKCRIHHRGTGWCSMMLMTVCQEWFCDCDWKPLAKKEGKVSR